MPHYIIDAAGYLATFAGVYMGFYVISREWGKIYPYFGRILLLVVAIVLAGLFLNFASAGWKRELWILGAAIAGSCGALYAEHLESRRAERERMEEQETEPIKVFVEEQKRFPLLDLCEAHRKEWAA